MSDLKHLFDKNRQWSEGLRRDDPEFFQRLSRLQEPEYLWIGCLIRACRLTRSPACCRARSSSTATSPTRSVQRPQLPVGAAVRCRCCASSTSPRRRPLRLRRRQGRPPQPAPRPSSTTGCATSRTSKQKHAAQLAPLADDKALVDRLCELNVIEQVLNVCQTTVVQEAWNRGQELTIHGWIFGLDDSCATSASRSTPRPPCRPPTNRRSPRWAAPERCVSIANKSWGAPERCASVANKSLRGRLTGHAYRGRSRRATKIEAVAFDWPADSRAATHPDPGR